MLNKRLDALEQQLDEQERPQVRIGLPPIKFIFLDSEDLPEGHYRLKWPDE